MKIIDDKGRLFGIINIIDLTVIGVFLFLIPSIYFGYKLLKKPVLKNPILTSIDLDCVFTKINPQSLNSLKVGAKDIDEYNKTMGEILWIGQIRPYKYRFNIGGEQPFITKEDAILKEVDGKVRLMVKIDGDNLYYKDKKIAINSPVVFNISGYSFTLLPSNEKERLIKLEVKFSGIIPELNMLISEGNVETDPSGKIVGRIQKIISKRNTDVLVFSDNKLSPVTHPFLTDVIVSAEILCMDKDSTLYFKNYPVKIGNTITFTTSLYSISGIIVGMEAI